jgi:integrase
VRRTPRLIERAGTIEPPASPQALAREHLELLRRTLPWAPSTIALHFAALRKFARWAGNPLAGEVGAWAVPAGSPSHRRWLDRADLAHLYRSSRGLERVLVSLEGFNGLRRVEVLRLRRRDVDLAAHRLRVLGKGKNGGKWRTVPLFSETENVLRRARDGGDPEGRVVPLSRSGADLLLRRAARRAGFERAGLKVSHHDLRRTFGRLSHQAGMDLVQLKNLYGHSSLDQTVHYIGLDEDQMRAGLASLARVLHPLLGRTSRPLQRSSLVTAGARG